MRRYVGYPNSMVVIGDSAAIGKNSDPSRPGAVVRANSWATGTNPAVNSLYRRMLAHNAAIRGHNFNLAEPGGTVTMMAQEAQRALRLNPRPDLFVTQVMDNDLVCPAAAADLGAFRARFVSALNVISKGAPSASLFVVSQFGSPGAICACTHPCRAPERGRRDRPLRLHRPKRLDRFRQDPRARQGDS